MSMPMTAKRAPRDCEANVMLLNGYRKLALVYQQFQWLSSFSATVKKTKDAKNQEYWYVTGWFFPLKHTRAQQRP